MFSDYEKIITAISFSENETDNFTEPDNVERLSGGGGNGGGGATGGGGDGGGGPS